MGRPEPLPRALTGFWSRRMTLEHRLVHEVTGDTVIFQEARYHY
jgi:toxin YoeB